MLIHTHSFIYFTHFLTNETFPSLNLRCEKKWVRCNHSTQTYKHTSEIHHHAMFRYECLWFSCQIINFPFSCETYFSLCVILLDKLLLRCCLCNIAIFKRPKVRTIATNYSWSIQCWINVVTWYLSDTISNDTHSHKLNHEREIIDELFSAFFFWVDTIFIQVIQFHRRTKDAEVILGQHGRRNGSRRPNEDRKLGTRSIIVELVFWIRF